LSVTQKESGRKIHSSRKPAGFFAITAPGLEELLAEEILQLTGRHGETSSGGVAFQGGLKDMRRLNLWSRIANRVLVRADEFHASSFHELERRAKQVGWERFVSVGHAVRFRVTCRESRLYHSDAVAERLAASVNARVGGNERLKQVPSRRPEREATDTAADVTIDDEENAYGEQLFIVRIANDTCSISADSSGELLHRRGYRQAVAKAPLRETIAAAMVVASGWDMASPLVDPMCGAGTIAIEAAMIARRIPPGASRRFAFEHWPRHDAKVWQAEVDAARAESLPRAAGRIIASDRDEGAVEAARSNAERAGVSKDIEFSARALSAAELPEQDGWVVTNPPYGMRLGDTAPLRNLYAQLGTIMRSRASGYRIALLSADSELEDQMKMELTEVFRTSNGGIPVHLVAG
jgi:putative N6-adenine-specific DNA methylase